MIIVVNDQTDDDPKMTNRIEDKSQGNRWSDPIISKMNNQMMTTSTLEESHPKLRENGNDEEDNNNSTKEESK